jgi:hypothetical protein
VAEAARRDGVIDFLKILLPEYTGKHGTRTKKIRAPENEARARSMAGEREREKFNRETAMAFIKADPRRLAEWKRRNPGAAC